jgi:AdoMet-dependent rRNA methyltransferase SPB1
MAKNKCDSFYFLAKKHGFRSRAAFKLIEINRKYKILEKSNGILDLCAAPGSWTQVANKISPNGSLVLGVDAQKIRPIKNCYFLRGDITAPSIIKTIHKIKRLDGRQISVILHDGAPKIGASWLKDVLNQNELALSALKIGVYSLEKGGNFISKVFRSEFLHGILYISRCFFEKVLLFKPSASRNSSTEIYLICKKFKTIGKFDPFFFSSDYIFSFSEMKTIKNPKNEFEKNEFEKNEFEKNEFEKKILNLIRKSPSKNSLKEKSFKIEDEYETIFGISLFSKTLSCKEIEHFVEIKTNLKIDLLLQWAKLFLNFNK